MDAKEAKKDAEFLADVVGRPFTVINLRAETSFFAVFRTDQVNNFPDDFKDWNILYTIYPWHEQARLYHQKGEFSDTWILDGIKKKAGRDLTAEGWTWYSGSGRPGAWVTKSNEAARRTAKALGFEFETLPEVG